MASRTSARSVAFRALLSLALSAWCAAVATVSGAAISKSPPCPEVVKSSHSVRLRLPLAFGHALAEAAPGFRPLTMADFSKEFSRSYRVTGSQAPWAVIGDFDGDGFCDLIVDGRTRTDSYRLCAWGSPEGPRVMTLGRRRLPAHVGPSTAALTIVPREEALARITARADTTRGDVFGEQTSGGLTTIYYWRGSRFAALRGK
jgi:hypothetical protein